MRRLKPSSLSFFDWRPPLFTIVTIDLSDCAITVVTFTSQLDQNNPHFFLIFLFALIRDSRPSGPGLPWLFAPLYIKSTYSTKVSISSTSYSFIMCAKVNPLLVLSDTIWHKCIATHKSLLLCSSNCNVIVCLIDRPR